MVYDAGCGESEEGLKNILRWRDVAWAADAIQVSNKA